MRYMHAADVFLAIADLSNVGNPLLEAMACGMCVVAVDAGDTRDLIIDNKTGRLVDSSNAPASSKSLEERLADLLVALAGDAPQRQRLAAGAAAYAGEHFWTWDQRMAAEVEAVAAVASSSAKPRGPAYDTILAMLDPESPVDPAPRGSFLGHVNIVLRDVRARRRARVRVGRARRARRWARTAGALYALFVLSAAICTAGARPRLRQRGHLLHQQARTGAPRRRERRARVVLARLAVITRRSSRAIAPLAGDGLLGDGVPAVAAHLRRAGAALAAALRVMLQALSRFVDDGRRDGRASRW